MLKLISDLRKQEMEIVKLWCVVVATIVVCQVLPSGCAPGQVVTTTPSGPVIVNGTNVALHYLQQGFIFCWAGNSILTQLHQYQVVWRGPGNSTSTEDVVRHWSPSNQRVFVVANAGHLPQSYLVFRDPGIQQSARYTCSLLYQKELVASVVINVHIHN